MTPIEEEAWALYNWHTAGSDYLVPTWQDLTDSQRVYWIRRAMRENEAKQTTFEGGLIGTDVPARLPILSPGLRLPD